MDTKGLCQFARKALYRWLQSLPILGVMLMLADHLFMGYDRVWLSDCYPNLWEFVFRTLVCHACITVARTWAEDLKGPAWMRWVVVAETALAIVNAGLWEWVLWVHLSAVIVTWLAHLSVPVAQALLTRAGSPMRRMVIVVMAISLAITYVAIPVLLGPGNLPSLTLTRHVAGASLQARHLMGERISLDEVPLHFGLREKWSGNVHIIQLGYRTDLVVFAESDFVKEFSYQHHTR